MTRCGHCHMTHPTKEDVKACAMAHHAARRDGRPGPRPTLDVSGYESDAGRCGRCAGTGEFITMVVNGRPTGPGGICFRCGGKGVQVSCGAGNHTHVQGRNACCDITRNAAYDRWGIRLSA